MIELVPFLLKPELAHERRVEGLEITLEGFENLHIALFVNCQCCARFIDESWYDDAFGRVCSPHRALRRVQGLVATSLSLEEPQKTIGLEFAFLSKWKSSLSEV